MIFAVDDLAMSTLPQLVRLSSKLNHVQIDGEYIWLHQQHCLVTTVTSIFPYLCLVILLQDTQKEADEQGLLQTTERTAD